MNTPPFSYCEPSALEYGCAVCKYKCSKQSNLKSHLSTKKHQNAIRESTDTRDNPPTHNNAGSLVFSCEPCGFSSIKRADYTRHIKTQKHTATIRASYTPPASDRVNTLEKHTSTNGMTTKFESTIEALTGVVLQMVQQNAEFQRAIVETQHQTQKQYIAMMESYKETRTPAIHNTHTTNNFNMQFFLNVTCKDAINISDFIHGLDIQPKDIERIGRVGFVEGITHILMNGLNELDQHKRPIHCTDLKRDTMFIKESDRWERDNENVRLLRAIETVEQTNCRLFTQTMTPSQIDSETSMVRYMSVLREVNGGSSREKNRAKIIKNISKACFLDRTGI